MIVKHFLTTMAINWSNYNCSLIRINHNNWAFISYFIFQCPLSTMFLQLWSFLKLIPSFCIKDDSATNYHGIVDVCWQSYRMLVERLMRKCCFLHRFVKFKIKSSAIHFLSLCMNDLIVQQSEAKRVTSSLSAFEKCFSWVLINFPGY